MIKTFVRITGLFSKDIHIRKHQLWAEELFKDLKGKINA